MKHDQPRAQTTRWRLANPFAVAGTGVRRRGHYFRRPRNIGIKRAIMAAFESLRGVDAPPDSYDDVHIAAMGHRSWKRHRRTQWRERK